MPTLPFGAPAMAAGMARRQSGAGILRGMDSPTNVAGTWADIAGSADEHGVPDAGFANAAMEAVNPGASAMEGLRRAIGGQRMIAREGQMEQDGDAMFNAPGRAVAQNRVADINSEAAAGREFFPNARRLYDRTRQDATQDALTRYVAPAQIGAQADIDAASIGGESRIEAARTGARERGRASTSDTLLKGLFNAMQTQMEAPGPGKPTAAIDPAQLTQMVQFLVNAGMLQ